MMNPARPRDRKSTASRSRGEPRWEAAERQVSKLLAGLLLDGYLVLNNVPFQYGNLDHVVIRPDGAIFLVETKSHRGRVDWGDGQLLVNNRPMSSNPFSQINRSIRWIRTMVRHLTGRNPWVVSILAFPNATVRLKHSRKRVNVLAAKDLLPFIRTYPSLR